ncbi:uncharacterized protein LOC131646726 [Vicia villosa]|uniref:uncharacterized protein LOC131646726 n=1 Tax=Vicia villosa TaxID=3911 RepID=UPI00273B7F26|nr:uncharacterized protein LOC131646726 [Vicia villosa]
MDSSKNTATSTPNNSPPVSPPHPPSEHDNTPTETNPIPEGSSENVIMKTAEEVWADLTAGDDGNEGGDGGNKDGGAQDGSASRPVAIAVTADGANVPVMRSGGAVGGRTKGSGSKKRKSNQVKDPPRGTPTCPECNRQFATWKAAFGHMRKHPERRHRGFFPPPTFESPQVPAAAAEGDGGNQVDDEEVQHVVRGLVMDLNQSLGAEEGSSAGGDSARKRRNQPASSEAALEPPPGSSAPSESRNRRNEPAPPAVDDEQNEEGRNKGFDLNKLPSSDDEEEIGEN